MPKTHLTGTKESIGVMPAMGVKLKIDTLERAFSAKTNKLMYVLTADVLEPEDYEGLRMMEWFVIGSTEDPKAQKEKTWKSAEGGPGRLKRLLVRSGTPVTDDDEEWCEAAEGQEVCAHVTIQKDDQGVSRNRIEGKYFREGDKDFVGIGVSLDGAPANGKAGKKTAHSKPSEDELDEELPEAFKKKTKAVVPEEEEDDEPPAKKKVVKKVDEDEDDD